MTIVSETRGLERRLALSYLGAFAIVLVAFALAVHVAFVLDVQRDVDGRLNDLVAQGRASIKFHHGRYDVERDDIQLSDPHLERVTWRDLAGREIAHVGSVVGPDVATRGQGDPSDVVLAAISTAPERRALARVDVGLVAGFLVSLVIAGFGGRYFARRAIARVVASMRTLRDFTADAAHELRGPLAAIRGNADASLRDAADLSPTHRRHLEAVDATARAMSRTVDDLLLIARAERPLARDLHAIDLDRRVLDIVGARRATAAAKGVGLEAEAAERARVYGDPAEIDRVLGNLVDNAVRFTPTGGRVDVTCIVERGGVCVRVRDTGVGIDPGEVSRIFERFWRSDAVRTSDTGTGLGLAIVRALVRRHGGDISVRSAPERGSEFTVWLPSRPPQRALHEFST